MAHLFRQTPLEPNDWEILIVDNASTDNTAEFAINVLEQSAGSTAAPSFRVLTEPELGLSNARKRGFREASGEIVCFLDDDNWVGDSWLQSVHTIFTEHPDVGAAGGPISEVLETEPPPNWFESFKGNFTIWSPRNSPGYWEQPLCGAGLCVRRSAWQQLTAHGFDFMLTDRKGNNLSSGGDFELCYALMLSGWRLWYDPALHIRHWMPSERITWQNLKRLRKGYGAQSVVFDAYTAPRTPSWNKEVLVAGKSLLIALLRTATSRQQRRSQQLLAESQKGRLLQLLKDRSRYRERYIRIQSAPWRKTQVN